MKYFWIDKDGSNKEKISKKEALKYISKHYRNPEYVLEHAERLFNNRIALTFGIILVKN